MAALDYTLDYKLDFKLDTAPRLAGAFVKDENLDLLPLDLLDDYTIGCP